MPKAYISLAPLIPWRSLDRPLDWPALFGRDAPLRLEIGCGNGERLARRAAAEPGMNHVGLDVSWLAARRALRKLAQGKVTNARVLQAEAGLALNWLFAPEGIQAVEMLFPRPWPEPRQEKRRLFGREFLRLLNNRLAEGARVRMVTDSRPYFEWATGQVEGSGFTAQMNERGPGLDTKYERRWLERGTEVFYELRLAKTEHLPAPPNREVALRFHKLKRFDPQRLAPAQLKGEIFVGLQELTYDPARQRALVRTVVKEDGLKQAFYLEAVWREDHWLLRVAPASGVIPTAGVQRALDLARELGGLEE